ncbi:MAG TPA: tRNA lysidine(34) synthetase TilS, partial [Candidatus Omnitrophota bacterium]|nr:tRNA lysidine(34) synthetase TilS [Candidatus Omnitrophota bacterium]
MSLLNSFQKSLKDHHLISKGDTVLIGVSGGSDSMGLLKAFCLIRSEWGLRLIAAHINHKLRKSADRDERFVSDYCQKHSIPLVSRTVSIDLENRSNSIEQKARDKRLKAIFEIARKQHASVLALAHHQDDLAETVLMRAIRGSGLAGLQSMMPKRDFKEARVIRPFLAVSKEEILAFCKEHKVPFRTDPTNRSKKFLRNRIRHELLPLLMSYNPQITRSLAVLAENSAEDYDLLRSEGLKCFKRCLQRSKNPKTVTL